MDVDNDLVPSIFFPCFDYHFDDEIIDLGEQGVDWARESLCPHTWRRKCTCTIVALGNILLFVSQYL